MDSIYSIQGYGKVGEAGSHDSCRGRARRRLLVLASSAALIIAVAAAVAMCVLFGIKRHDDHVVASPGLTPSPIVRAVCNLTRYSNSCLSALSSSKASAASDPEELLKLSLDSALDAFRLAEPLPKRLLAVAADEQVKSALSVCSEVVGEAVGMVNDSLARMAPGKDGVMLTQLKISDIRTWLSSALTDATTCLDTFDEVGASGKIRDSMAAALKNATEYTSNSLAIATGLEGLLQRFHLPLHRKLLAAQGNP